METLNAGTYTIEATTYDDAETGDFTLTITPAGAATTPTTGECLEDLGPLTAQVTRAGEWSSDCGSAEQDDTYARFYSFTLADETEVTIDLESGDTDTYLYLREGNARSGASLNDDGADDDAGEGTNSQAVETLSAGTYTIEATTYDDAETGDFTLTITPTGAAATPETGACLEDLGALTGQVVRAGEWSSDCGSAEQDDTYARFYSFTLADETEVTIDLESGDTDTYLYLREGNARSGASLNDDGADDDAGEGTNSQAVETLSADTYTIEATTYDEEETGDFTLTITPAGAATTPTTGECLEDLGPLTAQVVRAGEWSSDCESTDQDSSYARFYSFTLADETEVTIDLESGDTDTYLYLREGNARSGVSVNDHASDDDAGEGTNSQAVETLAAGAYTIETTTYDEEETGDFTLTVEVPEPPKASISCAPPQTPRAHTDNVIDITITNHSLPADTRVFVRLTSSWTDYNEKRRSGSGKILWERTGDSDLFEIGSGAKEYEATVYIRLPGENYSVTCELLKPTLLFGIPVPFLDETLDTESRTFSVSNYQKGRNTTVVRISQCSATTTEVADGFEVALRNQGTAFGNGVNPLVGLYMEITKDGELVSEHPAGGEFLREFSIKNLNQRQPEITSTFTTSEPGEYVLYCFAVSGPTNASAQRKQENATLEDYYKIFAMIAPLPKFTTAATLWIPENPRDFITKNILTSYSTTEAITAQPFCLGDHPDCR